MIPCTVQALRVMQNSAHEYNDARRRTIQSLFASATTLQHHKFGKSDVKVVKSTLIHLHKGKLSDTKTSY